MLLPLFHVIVPANASKFFAFMFNIAAFEFFEIGDPYDSLFSLEPTEALDVNYEALGFESLHFLLSCNSSHR